MLQSIVAGNQQVTLHGGGIHATPFSCSTMRCIMEIKLDDKDLARKGIIRAAKSYSKHLSGKVFLYVFGNEYIEVMFRADDFLHMTGTGSTKMNAREFFRHARDGHLRRDQFRFLENYPFHLVNRKLSCLVRIHELTDREVAVLKDMRTGSLVYKIALSNLEFSVGMYQRGPLYSPRTLRVKDKSFENSGSGEIVDFIFARRYEETKYTTCTFQDSAKEIPAAVLSLLDPALTETLSPAPPPSDPQPKIP